MERLPNSEDGQQRKPESDLSTDGILNKPYANDNLVSFGKRLQAQINEASDEVVQRVRANRAKDRINEHFNDQYGKLMFVGTNQAIVFQRGKDGEQNSALDFHFVTLSGELQSSHVIEIDKRYVVLEIGNASLYWQDKDDGTMKFFETDSPTLIPICMINNFELL